MKQKNSRSSTRKKIKLIKFSNQARGKARKTEVTKTQNVQECRLGDSGVINQFKRTGGQRKHTTGLSLHSNERLRLWHFYKLVSAQWTTRPLAHETGNSVIRFGI